METLTPYWPWLIAAVVIIVILATIAGRLLYLVHRQDQNQQAVEVVRQQEVEAHGLAALQSIRILAASYLDGQVEACEVALRINALQEHRDVSATCREQAAVFVELAGKLAHIPSHGQWKSLKRAERDAYREEMAALEEIYRDRLHAAARQLRLH